ncbi:MAG TPA: stalk domain-containing protein [Symbiobacteriaceae bacterium]|nr:stalk domain-containing protein [Symbiobacteriaceae bacterium]
MRPIFKLAVAGTLGMLLIGSIASAANVKEMIEVYRNQARLKVNGQDVTVENFVHNGTAYVPVTALSAQLGADVAWDAKTMTASVTTVRQTTLKGTVDSVKPVISLKGVGLRGDQVDAAELELAGKTVLRRFEISADQVAIFDDTAPADSNVLQFDQPYTLKLFAKNGARYQIQFTAGGLPDLTDTGVRRVVMVPAMPEKGFYWPYYLAVPSSQYKGVNQGHRRYLMIDTTNTGSSNNVAEMLNKARNEIVNRGQYSMSVAEELWAPMLFPAFPRPDVSYNNGGEFNLFYTHAFDRDTARLHLMLKEPNLGASLTQSFKQAGFDVNTLANLDLQLNAMIDHAIAYLNQYGHKVEPTKVMLNGYSASGTFTDRYTNLHPQRVKAVASGGTLDDMMLPLAELKGQKLIFPIGTSDYKEITGRSFDLAKHNQPARLIYMGEDDTNNVVPFGDCYGDKERKIITDLWGLPVLPRAKALIELYGKGGGKGMFILDKGIAHGMSREMQTYVKTFLAANRDSDEPVYPVPSNANQLKYTLFE